jgi:hypothetical protein
METLPKDLVNKLTEELSSQDLISFCASSTEVNIKKVCNNNDFWLRRFKKDFAPFVKQFPDLAINPKQRYLGLFSRISREAEDLTKTVLKLYGDFERFLTQEYKVELYNYFYNHILEILAGLVYKQKYFPPYDDSRILEIVEGEFLENMEEILPPGVNSYYWKHLEDDEYISFIMPLAKYLNLIS